MLTVLIGAPLDVREAQRLIDHRPTDLRVVYEPELLPVARYPGDHDGIVRRLSDEDLARWRSMLAEADVMYDFDWHDRAALPRTAPRLRWVQGTSSGIGEILRATGLDRTDIVFTTAAGIHAVPLAEFTVLGLLHFTKGMPQLRSWQTEHRWERFATRQLAGQRALVIGLGRVGGRIAATLAALGVEVVGMARTARPVLPEGVSRVIAPDELLGTLPDVDALVLATPDTAATHRLIGGRELAVLRPEAVIVNVARGTVIDEAALTEALRDGRIAGAALDVFETEPLPVGSPLWDLPNVLVSPHSASTIADEDSRLVDLFIENLDRYLAGRPLINVFDRERSY